LAEERDGIRFHAGLSLHREPLAGASQAIVDPGRAAYVEEKLNGSTGVIKDCRIILNYEWVLKHR